MLVKVALPALASAIGLIYWLVHAEQTAPLSEKPSIRLRVWTGDLPGSDLNQVLGAVSAQSEAVQAERSRIALDKAEHVAVAKTTGELLRHLEGRVAEKQATEWSSVLVASPPR